MGQETKRLEQISTKQSDVKARILDIYTELMHHDGFGSMEIRVRWLKRNLKEVLIISGKEYRYVVKAKEHD